jgi:hypothetical protein
MGEAQFMDAIRELCKLYGLLVFHCKDSRGSWGPGFPDLVIVGHGGVIFREAKTARGTTTTNQEWWAARLIQAGADWAIWRPADLTSGRIKTELERVAGR